MFHDFSHRFGALTRASIVAFALATGTAACDDPVEVEEEPDVATMRLTVGNQTVNVNADNGVVTGGPIVIPIGATTLTAQFLRSDGTADPLVTSATFRLEATSANEAVVTFNRTGAFAGTLNGLQAGQTPVTFDLFHIEEGHEEFGHPVTVQVQ